MEELLEGLSCSCHVIFYSCLTINVLLVYTYIYFSVLMSTFYANYAPLGSSTKKLLVRLGTLCPLSCLSAVILSLIISFPTTTISISRGTLLQSQNFLFFLRLISLKAE